MPSFSVSSGNYGYYYEHSPITTDCETVWNFIKQIGCLCFLCTVVLIPLWISYYIGGHYNEFYWSLQVYYFYGLSCVVFHILLAMCIILIISNSISNVNFIHRAIIHQNKRIIVFILIWFALSFICFIIFVINRDKTVTYYIFSHTEFTLRIYMMGLVLILPFIIPLFCFYLLIILTKILHINLDTSTCSDTLFEFEIELVTTSDTTNIELGECLLQSSVSNISNSNNIIIIINIILFYILMFVSSCNLYIFKVLNHSYIAEHFDQIIWTFLIITALLRKITKRIARNIDSFRQIKQQKKTDAFISICYLMEAYFSVYYYSFTKAIVAKSPGFTEQTAHIFIYLLIAHFMTEII
eukprot:468067_1